MPGNIGWQGAIIILIVLLVVFGPKRLPEMGRSLGRGMREFKDSITGKDDDDDQPREIPRRRAHAHALPLPVMPPSSGSRAPSRGRTRSRQCLQLKAVAGRVIAGQAGMYRRQGD